jgi:hypothetical protein
MSGNLRAQKGANVLKAHPGDGKAETLILVIKPVDEPAFPPETAKFRSPSLPLFKRLSVVSRTIPTTFGRP